MANGKGFITIHRKIQDNPIWTREPFTWGQAWVDLLLMVNHKDKEKVIKNKKILIKRGQRLTTESYLGTRWKWSRGKVQRFLEYLKNDTMIETSKSKIYGTTITIVNYNDYQDKDTTNNTTSSTTINTTNEQRTDNRQDINNNDNNDNNDNKNNIVVYPYTEIIDYLNSKADKSYKVSTAKTRELIRARVNEGFSLKDFKKVIDNKISSWKGNSEMEQYLRPVTLFGSKFEGYLNETVTNSKSDSIKLIEEFERSMT